MLLRTKSETLGACPSRSPKSALIKHPHSPHTYPAGEVLLRTKSETLGRAASGWPKQALASLKRRHEYLLYAVQQRIGFVPKDAFYPLVRRRQGAEAVQQEILICA